MRRHLKVWPNDDSRGGVARARGVCVLSLFRDFPEPRLRVNPLDVREKEWKSMLAVQPGYNSSPLAHLFSAPDGRSSRTTKVSEYLMSFLQKSALHKHLATSRHIPGSREHSPVEGPHTILRDGNLVSVSRQDVEEQPKGQPALK